MDFDPDNLKSLARLLLEKSYREGDFTLASGRKSDWYFDCRVTSLSSRGAWLIGNLFCDMLTPIENPWKPSVAAAAGMTMGADPLVSAIAAVSWHRKTPVDALIVRKEAKDHGMGQSVEGLANLAAGSPVAVIDDVVTTGGSILKAWKRVVDAGLKPARMLAIIDREEGGAEAILKETGLPLEAIYTRKRLLKLGDR